MITDLKREVRRPGTLAKLFNLACETPYDQKVVLPDHQLILYVPPGRIDAELRCVEHGLPNFARAMPMRFRPADVCFEMRSLRGYARVLTHGFSNERLSEVADRDIDWREEDIIRGLDLSGSRLVPLILQMAEELSQPGMGGPAVFDALSTLTIYELVRYLKRDGLADGYGGGLTPRQLAIIRDRVEEDSEYAMPSLSELARLCSTGERNLQRLFKQSTGETIGAYVRRIQVERARRYLAASDLPLKEIAYRLGFAHASSFNAAFRKSTLETPGDYRRRLGA